MYKIPPHIFSTSVDSQKHSFVGLMNIENVVITPKCDTYSICGSWDNFRQYRDKYFLTVKF